MGGFLDRLLNRDSKSAYQAKERMRMVLIHDRVNMNTNTLENLKNEIIGVISRHVDIDSDSVRIEMTQEGRQQRLIADIPLKPSRRRGSG
ncbi:MAG: cell division topological specificity factor MinE [Anaerolineales bacterium]|nr:cell division topological specificity factor MinE [Anaerolineales bacterium]